MRTVPLTLSAMVLALITCNPVLAGDTDYGESPRQHLIQRLHPVGGWHPYGGGLTHWWDRHCLPCYSAPDDYCRKPLPTVCWPQYPTYYSWGSPEVCYPRNASTQECVKPH